MEEREQHLMEAVQAYLKQQLLEAVSKSVGVPVSFVNCKEGAVTVRIDASESDALFWKAVREALGED